MDNGYARLVKRVWNYWTKWGTTVIIWNWIMACALENWHEGNLAFIFPVDARCKDYIGVHHFVYKRKKKLYGYLLKVLQYISAYCMNHKVICIALYINMWIKIDETDEPFVSDEIIEYLRQWVHITNECKEAIQCSQ